MVNLSADLQKLRVRVILDVYERVRLPLQILVVIVIVDLTKR